MTRYTAECRRSGAWWAITVPELKGVHSQAKRLDQVEDMARDAIAMFLDAAPDSFDVDVQPDMPDEVRAALKAREEAAKAEERANRTTINAVRALLGSGLTVRDAGRLLRISPQRVSQLAQSTAQMSPLFAPDPKSGRRSITQHTAGNKGKAHKDANSAA
jgi:predicted RNase H-like HicB family nuclease